MLLTLQLLWQATPGYPMGDDTSSTIGRNTTLVESRYNVVAIQQSTNTILVEPKF